MVVNKKIVLLISLVVMFFGGKNNIMAESIGDDELCLSASEIIYEDEEAEQMEIQSPSIIWEGASLSLFDDGKFGVKFLVSYSGVIGQQRFVSEVVKSNLSRTATSRVGVEINSSRYQTQTYSIVITPAEIMCDVRLNLYDENNNCILSNGVNVYNYLRTIADDTGENYKDYEIEAAEALIAYGMNAKKYFNFEPETLQKVVHPEEGLRLTGLEDESVLHMEAFPYLHYIGTSLYVRDSVMINHYFYIDEGYKISYSDIDPRDKGYIYSGKNVVIMRSEPIGIMDFDKPYYSRIDKDGVKGYLKYSVLDYISRGKDKGGAFTELLRSMYYVHLCVK